MSVNLIDKEKEMKDIAMKVAVMEPQSIRTLTFAADVLLARDRMEKNVEVRERS